MSSPDSWWAKPFAKRKDNQFPPLTDEEREEILRQMPVTKCPTIRVVATFRQQVGRTP